MGAGPLAHAQDTPDHEALRTRLFSDPGQRACRLFSRGRESVEKNDLGVTALIEKIRGYVKKIDAKNLAKRFHPRLAINEDQLFYLLQAFSNVYGDPVDVSLYRVWALNTVDGTASAIPCADDQLALGPHYGYHLQFGVWLQISGAREVGRLYFSLVPQPGGDRWAIGAWHAQQWSYLGKDPDHWLEQALAHKAQSMNEIAYMELDLIDKLSNGAGYVMMGRRDDVVTTRDALFSPEAWLVHLRKMAETENIKYVGTIFSSDGPGLLLRIQVADDVKAKDLEKICRSVLGPLYRKLDHKVVGSSACGFIRAHENPAQDGLLGSRQISKKEILKSSQKR